MMVDDTSPSSVHGPSTGSADHVHPIETDSAVDPPRDARQDAARWPRRRSGIMLAQLRREPMMAPAALFLGLVIFGALFGPALVGPSASTMNLDLRNQPPVLFGGSVSRPLGTDPLGRDLLGRIVWQRGSHSASPCRWSSSRGDRDDHGNVWPGTSAASGRRRDADRRVFMGFPSLLWSSSSSMPWAGDRIWRSS